MLINETENMPLFKFLHETFSFHEVDLDNNDYGENTN